MHDALAAYYAPGVFDEAEAGGFIRDAVRASIERDVERFPAREAEVRREAELAEIMLEGYCMWLAETGEDEGLEVLAAESSLEEELIPGRCTLLSKLDAIVYRERDDALMNLEHKTVGTLKAALPLLQTDPQLLTEHVLQRIHLAGRGGPAARGVLYNQLRKVKRTARANPPFYGREVVMHSDGELESHWRHTSAWARQILEARARLDAGESHHEACPPNPSRDLTWRSEFFPAGVYSLMDDGSDWEAALRLGFERGDPLERYAGAGAFGWEDAQ